MSTHTFPFYSVNRKKYTIELVINDSTTYSYPFSLVDVGEITFGNEDLNSIILFPSTFEFSFYTPYYTTLNLDQGGVFMTIYQKLVTFSSLIKLYESIIPYTVNNLIMEWAVDSAEIKGDFQKKTLTVKGVDIFGKLKSLSHITDFPNVPTGSNNVSSILAMIMYYLSKTSSTFTSENQIINTYVDHQARGTDDSNVNHIKSFISFGTYNSYFFGDNAISKLSSNALESLQNLLKNFHCLGFLGYYINGTGRFYIIPRTSNAAQTTYIIENTKVTDDSYEPSSHPKKDGLKTTLWEIESTPELDLGTIIYDKNGNIQNSDSIEYFSVTIDCVDFISPLADIYGLKIWVNSQWVNVDIGYIRHGNTGSWGGMTYLTRNDIWAQIQYTRLIFKLTLSLKATDPIPEFYYRYKLPTSMNLADVYFRPLLIKRDIINNIFELTLLEIK